MDPVCRACLAYPSSTDEYTTEHYQVHREVLCLSVETLTVVETWTSRNQSGSRWRSLPYLYVVAVGLHSTNLTRRVAKKCVQQTFTIVVLTSVCLIHWLRQSSRCYPTLTYPLPFMNLRRKKSL